MSEINETIKRAGEGAQRITNEALAYESDSCPKLAAILRTEAVAIRFLIALHTGTCERIKQLEKVAAHQHAMLEDLACHTACSCDAAFTGRGRHEPNSLCHLDAEMVVVLQEYRSLSEIAAKQEQGNKERT